MTSHGQFFGQAQEIEPRPTDFAILSDMDGDEDILSHIQYDHDVRVYENDGQGNYSDGVQLETGLHLPSVRTFLDIDDDGDIDIFNFSSQNDSVQISWSENVGITDLILHEFDLGLLYAKSSQITDLDTDGFPDIIFLTDEQDVKFMLNDGTGIFTEELDLFSVEETFYSIDHIDLNLDGYPELLFGSNSTEIATYWAKNLGDLTFDPVEILVSEHVNSNFIDRFIDYDNDQDLDFLIQTLEGISVIENDNNSFLESDTILISSTLDDSPSPFTIRQVDVDSDGNNDLILNYFNGDVSLIENYGNGTFSSNTNLFISPEDELGMPVWNVSMGDVDMDGKLDLLASGHFPSATPFGSLYWLKNLLGESCTDSLACNFTELAVLDDGSCCFENCICTDSNALNFNLIGGCPSLELCFYVPGDMNGDNLVTMEDLTLFLSQFSAFCEEDFCPADLDNNGIINTSDLVNFLSLINP